MADLPVAAPFDLDRLRHALGGPLPDRGEDPASVLDTLAAASAPGLVATTGPRYFGFVVGGAGDAATCADLLTTGWDQPAFNAVTSPAAAVVEEVVGRWLTDLLGLPAGVSFGLVTGGQGANTVGAGGGPPSRAGPGRLGRRARRPRRRPAGPGGGRRRAPRHHRPRRCACSASAPAPSRRCRRGPTGPSTVAALAAALAAGPAGPTIVCVQAGNVNSGACDDIGAACDAAGPAGAWVHVDGAFGLWAAANPATAHLVAGIERADSWATDGHKWLNVPYDSGFVLCAHPDAHVASMSFAAAYLEGHGTGPLRAPADHVPESSRRARGFATWAALRQLGRDGVADLVERCCALARRFAEQLAATDGVTVANQVVLNQVLVDFGGDDRTDRVIAVVQRDGTCWMGGTSWHGRRLMRISVSNWSTTEADVDRSVAAIRRVLAEDRAAFPAGVSGRR